MKTHCNSRDCEAGLIDVTGLCIPANTTQVISVTPYWKQMHISESLQIPAQKPDVVADIPAVGDAVAAAVALLLTAVDTVVQTLQDAGTAILGAVTLIGSTTYFTLIPNEEGTYLTGRKLIVEGVLHQKVVYTGLAPTQSVHSVHNTIPFTAYIIPYAKFEGLTCEKDITVIADPDGAPCNTITISGFAFDPSDPPVVDLCEEFCVNGYVEDIFANEMDCRTIFKNVTLFLLAKPATICG